MYSFEFIQQLNDNGMLKCAELCIEYVLIFIYKSNFLFLNEKIKNINLYYRTVEKRMFKSNTHSGYHFNTAFMKAESLTVIRGQCVYSLSTLHDFCHFFLVIVIF